MATTVPIRYSQSILLTVISYSLCLCFLVLVLQLDRESHTILLWIVCNLGTTLNLVLGPFVTLMNCFEGFKSVLVQKNFLTVTDLKI